MSKEDLTEILLPKVAASFVCCQAEVSATSCSLVQRNPTECGGSLCII
jgi:hypothetical protein